MKMAWLLIGGFIAMAGSVALAQCQATGNAWRADLTAGTSRVLHNTQRPVSSSCRSD